MLAVLPCSKLKRTTSGSLIALERYDGPLYRIFRSYLRQHPWPANLRVAILSAEFGLVGALASVPHYDRILDGPRANELRGAVTDQLAKWAQGSELVFFLGRRYLDAIDFERLSASRIKFSVVDGPIGKKLQAWSRLLHQQETVPRKLPPQLPRRDRPLYFLPDWDDYVDEDFDFENDAFSAEKRNERHEVHCSSLMGPERLSDGILVSLAQQGEGKGILHRVAQTDGKFLEGLRIGNLMGLPESIIFGDCGAFSYVTADVPPISPRQAAATYQWLGFDFGASVDHIPVSETPSRNGTKHKFSFEDQQKRVRLTQENAEEFLRVHRENAYTFRPVGVIQSVEPGGYAPQALEYEKMGYQYIALGGLVFRQDKEILEIVREVKGAVQDRLAVHAFGIYRPRVHRQMREFGLSSFDSASYFRKAWLRSGQNYLVGNRWYAAIRVPSTRDTRTRKRLIEASGLALSKLEMLERNALTALAEYGTRRLGLRPTLEAIYEYDGLLSRTSDFRLAQAYKRTLEERPWETCDCPVCQQLKINVVIFRGYNRNKRRGAHNTLQLYRQVTGRDISRDPYVVRQDGGG